jgi:hypothetical protein
MRSISQKFMGQSGPCTEYYIHQLLIPIPLIDIGIINCLFPRGTSTNTTKLWAEFAWCAILLASIVSLAVVLTVSTRSVVGSLATPTRSWLQGVGANRLAVCFRDDLCGEVKPFTEILNAVWCKGVVVPLP